MNSPRSMFSTHRLLIILISNKNCDKITFAYFIFINSSLSSLASAKHFIIIFLNSFFKYCTFLQYIREYYLSGTIFEFIIDLFSIAGALFANFIRCQVKFCPQCCQNILHIATDFKKKYIVPFSYSLENSSYEKCYMLSKCYRPMMMILLYITLNNKP